MATETTHRVQYAIEELFSKAKGFFSPPEEALLEVGIKQDWHVLDFGCGIGSYSLAAAKVIGDTGKVYAVDINPHALEHVKQAAVRGGLHNVETILTDCYTGIESESIDAVLLYDVFHDLCKPRQVINELARVLKWEGVLSFSDHHLMEKSILPGLAIGGRFTLLRKNFLTYTFKLSYGCA
jgi:ubiquinone/menaquinone biosynthesis C-methylase UbiE